MLRRNCGRRASIGAVAGAVAGAALAASLTSALAADAATFEDCFRRETARTSPVEGFTAHGGTWRVADGELHASAGPGPKLVADLPAFAEGETGVEVFFPHHKSGGNAGLIVKVSDCGVGADRFNGYEVTLDTAGHLVFGRHRQNWRGIRNVPCDVPVGRWIPLVVKMTATTIEVLVDGKSILQYEDIEAPLKSGRVGLRPWQREARFRNFWISTGGRRTDIPFVDARARDGEGPADALERAKVPPIAFVTRYPLSRPNTISCDIWQSRPSQPGCSIRTFDPSVPELGAKTIFSDPDGCIYDMNVSFDARTLFFSYRGKGERHWHIWRIGVDGTGLKRLTEGPYHDISPCLMPNGDIVFVSTRRFGYTVCQPGPASNLHVMSSDGANIRCVSMNTLSDFSPQMLPDGRVLFTRWEYIDRDLTYRQSLWTQNPDGTCYQLYFGNTIRDVGSFWQARALPGKTDRVLATFAPHHGHPHGAIGIIDTRRGREAPRGRGFAWITNEFPEIRDRSHEWSYRDPFPLSDSLMLCSYGGGDPKRFRIFLVNARDEKRLLIEDPEMSCFFPLPLVPTAAPPVLASRRGEDDLAPGTFVLTDVYEGLTGIERGRAKSLRVMEQVRKTEDLVSRAYDESPVMSYGTYYAKRTWGTVPILEDGSAHFRVPSLREIYFQVLDAEGRELQRMTSAAQIMPGERVSCIGCHEPRSSGPPRRRVPLAARRPASDLVRPDCAADGIIDFPTVVQPVLDKYCVKCHGGADPKGGMVLTGDRTRFFSMAYDNLLGRSRSYRQHNMTTGEMLPSERARGKPLVHFYWLLKTPTAVNQPLWTGSHASRLLKHIDTDHCGKMVPLEDRRRVYLWIDANVPYYGTYAHSRPKSPGRRDLCTDVATGRESEWYARRYRGVYDRRCASCHGKLTHPNDKGKIWDGRLAWINFTRPELSPALTAHLPKPLGRGIVKAKNGKPLEVFRGTSDPDYRAMLSAIREGRESMLAAPRADMRGFKGARPEP
jgi:mono/diheme cytochrome c family protein